MIYLDNSATTRVCPRAAELAHYYMTEQFFNPSSLYKGAVETETHMSAARERLARLLGVNSSEVYYTSGGTESDNIAILGRSFRGPMEFVTTRLEHPAAFNCFARLEQQGHKVIYLDNDNTGAVNPEQVLEVVNERTALVSVIHVNNELGTVQPLGEIYRAVKRKNPAALFHSDGVQAFSKLPFGAVECDLYSVSGHKLHAPKGIGALMLRQNAKGFTGQLGGGQERGLRSGTSNVPGIMAMDGALCFLAENQHAHRTALHECKNRLAHGLMALPDAMLNGPPLKSAAPHILNVSFLGVRGEVLLHALEARGVYVSTGSACSSHKRGKNRVLEAIGITGERAEGAVRFSLGYENTPGDMDKALEIIQDEVAMLRRFKRR